MIEARDATAGTGHPNERVMASAAHLAEHLAEVPAIAIPTIIGVHDGSGRPGLFDSVIQSVWSFCVALRARGLGTAWTTPILTRQDDLADLLDIPPSMTQIALIPVAWTKGIEFRRAPRYPAREITYIDGFARTWERGPSEPPRQADGPGTVVEIDIKAQTSVVWPYVTDIRFELASIAGATRLRHIVVLGPGPSGITAAIEQMPDKEARILARRIGEHRTNMRQVIEGIKAAAEADAAAANRAARGPLRP